jgi:pyruvate dehydrogenase E2 component (dihydrolipoamide acetyltransferase)
MSKQDITVPEIGEKITSGTVVGVMVKQGDRVRAEDPVIEFETDKAVVEIPAPADGVITEVLVKEGQDIDVGAVIARMDTQTDAQAEPESEAESDADDGDEPEQDADAQKSSDEQTEQEASAKTETPEPRPEEKTSDSQEASRRMPERESVPGTQEGVATASSLAPASPTVRRLARELGADINQIDGSGPGGRITPDDVKSFVKQVVSGRSRPTSGAAVPELPDFSRWGDIEREDMTTVRRITAEGMANAWTTVAHVTQFDKADITALEQFRRQYNPLVEKEGGKLTVTAILLKVIASALQRFPRFNATVDMNAGQIVYKSYCHVGIAVDTDRGLLVPVIRDVDKKGIKQLSIELKDVSDRARSKKVSPEDLEGGTFTISNQGGIGGTDFTPIVYWPQVAILGVSRAGVEPRFIDGEFQPRTMLPLSLSYDHRANDGADAARFLRWVTEALENPFLLHFD